MAIASLTLTAGTLTTTTAAATPVAPPRAATASPGETCTPVTPGTKAAKDGGATLCVGPAKPAAAPTERASGNSCDDGKAYSSTRHSYCMSHDVPAVLRDKSGVIIGFASVRIVQTSTLDPKFRYWHENVSATTTDATPNMGSMALAGSATCPGMCTMENGGKLWAGASVVIDPGKTKEGLFTFKTTVGKDQETDVTPVYRWTMYSTGGDPVRNTGGWTSNHTMRCDQKVGKDADAGCIVKGIMADVQISTAKYGAAAATYEWAQKNLTGGHFGTKEAPLQRDRDDEGKRTKAKRYQSCDAAPNPFKPILVTQEPDSCDEYPFAASVQGGTNGDLCAEIQPWWNTDHWEVKPIRFPGPALNCVRSHVPLSQNTGAGGEYGRAVLSERILDRDSYTVTITP